MKNVCFTLNRKVWVTMALLLTFAFPALAQKITVHGYVDDTLGDPLIGATVIEKGTTNGTATDVDGNFTLNVNPNATLVISYIGYDPQEVAVNGKTNIKVTLSENSTMLAETVVIGYGSVKKSDATGSVAVIKPSEVEAGLATSAQDLLVGASPGVVVTLDGGNPSGGANIQIRGGASLSASNAPLIVVDGVPMDTKGIKGSSNPLGLISPENVESMTILKDASATAIYGSRASNGVIIITTKKGKSGRPQVNFTANMYVNTPRKYLDMMDGPTFSNYIRKEYGTESIQAEALGKYDTNWVKEALHTTISSDYNLSVGGTVGFLPYRVAVSYTNNNGILRGTSMDRVTGSINLTPKFWNDLLSINLNVKGAYVNNEYADNMMGGCTSMNPTLPIRDFENGGAYLGYWTTYTGSGLVNADSPYGSINITTAPINPISQQLEHKSEGKSYQSIGNLQIDLKMPFLTDLRANLNLGYDIQKGDWFGYYYPNTPKAWAEGFGIKMNPDSDDVTVFKIGGVNAGKQHQIRRNLLLDFYLNYNHEWESIGSTLDVTAGYSWQRFHNKGHDYSYIYSVGNPAYYPAQYQGQDFSQYVGHQAYPTTYYAKPLQLVSFFGRINYSVLNKYLITGTVRYDGTSRFSKSNRWGLFPSVALGWKLLDENFMEGARDVMNELKIRAGYGVTGQQDLGEDYLFPYLPVYNVSTDVSGRYPLGDTYYYPVTPKDYNADIKWEETRTWNAGIDFGFVGNRVSGAIDFYKRKTVDLLTFANYPAGSNLTNQGNINIGDLENIGLEFTLNTRPVVTDNFTWNSNLNVGWNKNKITRLAEGADTQVGDISVGTGGKIQKHEVGFSAFSFYVYEQVYDQDGNPLDGVFVDRNGDGEITESDKYLYHAKDPKVTLTWTNTFNYKNWDLGITLRSNIGNWVYNETMASNVFKSTNNDVPLSNMMNNTHLFAEQTLPQIMSDYFVQNASFVRCDNISLGYTWRDLLKEKLRIRLYGAVQNPFVITKYKGLDPEIFNGIDNGVYPNPITFSLGVVASF